MRREAVLQAFAETEAETLEDAAAEIGMSRAALDKVLERARRDGDPRAEWRGLGWRKGKSVRPRFHQILTDWKSLPNRDTLPRAEAASLIGCTYASLVTTLCAARKEGLLDQSAEDEYLRSEWQHLRNGGITIHEAARRLSTTETTLRRLS